MYELFHNLCSLPTLPSNFAKGCFPCLVFFSPVWGKRHKTTKQALPLVVLSSASTKPYFFLFFGLWLPPSSPYTCFFLHCACNAYTLGGGRTQFVLWFWVPFPGQSFSNMPGPKNIWVASSKHIFRISGSAPGNSDSLGLDWGLR